MGRKRRRRKLVKVSFNMYPNEKKLLEEAAELTGRSQTFLLRHGLLDYLQSSEYEELIEGARAVRTSSS